MIPKLVVIFLLILIPLQVNGFCNFISDILSCYKVRTEDVCPNKDVTFWLFTPNVSNYELRQDDLTSLKEAPFIMDQKIVILIHGYTGNKDTSPNLQIRPKLLDKGYNVISVDYEPAAFYPCYIKAVANSKIVAKCLFEFIKTLLTVNFNNHKNNHFTIEDLHLIGFSLGGQIAGKTGSFLKEADLEMSRITGLDVAGPLFYGPSTYLTKNCAKFVDCIHTNSGKLGKLFPIGDVDFYVNNLIHQNGCKFWNLTCDHSRAPELYAESIDSEDGFYGVNFNGDWEIMGHFLSTSAKGIYHVETNGKPPYAQGLVDKEK